MTKLQRTDNKIEKWKISLTPESVTKKNIHYTLQSKNNLKFLVDYCLDVKMGKYVFRTQKMNFDQRNASQVHPFHSNDILDLKNIYLD